MKNKLFYSILLAGASIFSGLAIADAGEDVIIVTGSRIYNNTTPPNFNAFDEPDVPITDYLRQLVYAIRANHARGIREACKNGNITAAAPSYKQACEIGLNQENYEELMENLAEDCVNGFIPYDSVLCGFVRRPGDPVGDEIVVTAQQRLTSSEGREYDVYRGSPLPCRLQTYDRLDDRQPLLHGGLQRPGSPEPFDPNFTISGLDDLSKKLKNILDRAQVEMQDNTAINFTNVPSNGDIRFETATLPDGVLGEATAFVTAGYCVIQVDPRQMRNASTGMQTVLHEMSHCFGVGHQKRFRDVRRAERSLMWAKSKKNHRCKKDKCGMDDITANTINDAYGDADGDGKPDGKWSSPSSTCTD